MSKILLIIKREYLTRVRKKSFILSTLLFPLLYLAFIGGTTYLAKNSTKNLRVALIDSSGLFDRGMVARSNQLDSSSTLEYVAGKPAGWNYTKEGYDALIVIPPTRWEDGINNLKMKSEATHGLGAEMGVERKLNSIWSGIKYEKLGIDEVKRTALENSRIKVEQENVSEDGEKKTDANVASAIGYLCGFLIYFILLIYGAQVMMGVMEEKTNRIAEVIISSVRPFQLMLGKILGIGLVALTQFFLWILFVFIIYNVFSAAGNSNDMLSGAVGSMKNVFDAVDLPLVIFCFGFYLLGGFFFYSSLYAAIGSTVNEDMREAQSLSFPITLLVIFSIALMTSAMTDPTGPVAVWASIIPFSSPIVMMARIPFGVPGTVPYWQLATSMGVLVAGFILTTWISGKIYRTGILMYGKKASWKEMGKWVFTKS